MKQNLYFILAGIVLFALPSKAQDTRERTYYYEVLEPRHEPKPLVEGFAKERVDEKMGRGLVAAKTQDGKAIHLSWRVLKTDDAALKFNVYRSVNGKSKKLNSKPVVNTSDFVDTTPVAGLAEYWVEGVLNKKSEFSDKITVDFSKLETTNYVSVKLKGDVRAGKIAVADLNGDGVYDYIIRHPHTNVDPGTKGDTTGVTFKIEAYLSDGAYLWTKDLGLSIEPGIWYSPFVAYDFDGDGKAEVAIKTGGADYKRNELGRVYGGSEYLTILNGMTGKEIASVDWPERNDRYGNLVRQNRNQMGMAFLDGKTPCILAARGTYKLLVVDAWQLKNGKLEKVWRWDGDEENPIIRSQGSHNMVCGDIDGDGRDEVLIGSCAIDDNGTLLWSTGLGHPDKVYLTDIDPSRPGMEVFLALEPWHENGYGVCTVDAKTGEKIWGIGHKTFHVGDGMVADIDPAHPGLECFASEDSKGGSSDKYLLTSTGEKIGMNADVPPCRNWIWWNGGLVRQTFFGDDNRWGAGSSSNGRSQSIGYWKGEKLTEGIQGDIIMIADLLGDWREEVVTALPGELRIYHTAFPAKDKRVTLMQDPVYRSYILERSQGYPQSPVPSYYLGE
ncbi:silent information regulator protein Sir2 [Viscerimonas tarda]